VCECNLSFFKIDLDCRLIIVFSLYKLFLDFLSDFIEKNIMTAAEEKLNYTIVEKLGMKFIISCTPRPDNLQRWIDLWKAEGVKNVVRACEPTYEASELEAAGIHLHEMEYSDGSSPSPQMIQTWLELVESVFPRRGHATPEAGTAIAVHCVAGLGRAPLFVVLAFIERGMKNLEAVDFVRSKRRGSVNAKQLEFVRGYQRRHKECLIM